MLFRMAPLALTWNDLERSKSRSSIFQRAATWKRLQIGPNLLSVMDRKSCMGFQSAPLLWTWSDLGRSFIFQTAVPWKRLQIGPWLPLKLNRKSQMLFQMAPVVVTWSYLHGDTLSLVPVANLIGMGCTVPHGTVRLVINAIPPLRDSSSYYSFHSLGLIYFQFVFRLVTRHLAAYIVRACRSGSVTWPS